MLFPVRCVFWLGVVYTSIAWPGVEAGGAGGRAAADLTNSGLRQALTLRAQVADACLAAPAACAGGIAAMTRAAANIVPVPLARPKPAGTDTLRAEDRTAASPPRALRRMPG